MGQPEAEELDPFDLIGCHSQNVQSSEEDWTQLLRDVDLKMSLLGQQFFDLCVLTYQYLIKVGDFTAQQLTFCLAVDLRTFQHNVHRWIDDRQTIDRLKVAVDTVIDAHLALTSNTHDLSLYLKFPQIMAQVKVLKDFFRGKPKFPDRISCQRMEPSFFATGSSNINDNDISQF